jgi:hypothetical protein
MARKLLVCDNVARSRGVRAQFCASPIGRQALLTADCATCAPCWLRGRAERRQAGPPEVAPPAATAPPFFPLALFGPAVRKRAYDGLVGLSSPGPG